MTTNADMVQLIEAELKKIQAMFQEKAAEYVDGPDALQNFYDGAVYDGTTPEETCLGYFKKHNIALKSFIKRLGRGKKTPMSQWNEKIGDIILYHILLKAIILDREKGAEDPITPNEENDGHC